MKPLLLSAICSLALARGAPPKLLLNRQSCPSSYKICGAGCILTSWECCADGSGGCGPGTHCQLGTNAEYGCCSDGEYCDDEGGAHTEIPYSTSYDTSTYYSYYSTSSYAVYTTSSYYNSYTKTTSSSRASETFSSNLCDDGWEPCGTYCIPEGWTCCPDQQGGCDASEDRCFLGSNGNYGCCPLTIDLCTGAPGEATTLPEDYSDTNTYSYSYSFTYESETSDFGQPSDISVSTATSPTHASTTPNPVGASTTTTQAVSTAASRASTFASQTSVTVPTSFSEAQHVHLSNPFTVLLSAVAAAIALILPW